MSHDTRWFKGTARLLGTAFFWVFAGSPLAQAQDAAALTAKHQALQEALEKNAFKRPIYLQSNEKDGEIEGEVFARVSQPFATVAPAMRELEPWCDILVLQPNVKRCHVGPTGDTLILDVGRKFDQPLSETYQLEFAYSLARNDPDYLQVVLSAAQGPLGTRNYRIVFEAAALAGGNSFVHLSYAYEHGIAARMAAGAYLATIGRDKIGFSVVGKDKQDRPIYIGGTRGVVERNAMRWYLAIDAYLGALPTPEPARFEKRLATWYANAERYAAQLHELERQEYLDMKRKEMRRHRALAPVTEAHR